MAERILCEPEVLIHQANEERRLQEEHERIMRRMTNLVNSLQDVWTGAAQDELYAQFANMRPFFEKFNRSLIEYGNAMNNSARQLQAKDEQAAAGLCCCFPCRHCSCFRSV